MCQHCDLDSPVEILDNWVKGKCAICDKWVAHFEEEANIIVAQIERTVREEAY